MPGLAPLLAGVMLLTSSCAHTINNCCQQLLAGARITFCDLQHTTASLFNGAAAAAAV
jgi:hypothetical protein